MPRQRDEDAELQKHTLHLYKGDFERLSELVPDVSPSELIRRLVRKQIEDIEGAVRQKAIKVQAP